MCKFLKYNIIYANVFLAAEDPYDTSHFHREFNGTSVSAKTPSYDLSNSQVCENKIYFQVHYSRFNL